MTVRLRNGQYRFLFSHGDGEHLKQAPETLEKGVTGWEDVWFSLVPNASTASSFMPADELYLQYPASQAERTYALDGSSQTVKADLGRAVGRILVVLKRGYIADGKYVELPYDAPHNILEDVGSMSLKIDGAGRSVRPDGSAGTARILYDIASGSQKEITPDGFAEFEGPFVIPPSDGKPVSINISVEPAAGSSMPASSLNLTGTVERNKFLEITLWITSAYPEIGISIDTLPMTGVKEGDSGMWE